MRETLDMLFQLQTIDSTIIRHQKTLNAMDDGTKSGQKLSEAQTVLDSLQEELGRFEAHHRAKELELKGTDEECKKRTAKAYGGTVADTKELASLEKKIAELKRKMNTFEDEILETLEKIEEKRQQVEHQSGVTAQVKRIHEETCAHYAEIRKKLEQEVAVIIKDRREILQKLDGKMLAEYEALQKKLGGVAVAVIEGNLCGSCRTTLSSGLVNRVRKATEMVKCENCRRILHMKP